MTAVRTCVYRHEWEATQTLIYWKKQTTTSSSSGIQLIKTSFEMKSNFCCLRYYTVCDHTGAILTTRHKSLISFVDSVVFWGEGDDHLPV